MEFNINDGFDLSPVNDNKKKVNFVVLFDTLYNKGLFPNTKIHSFCYFPEKKHEQEVAKKFVMILTFKHKSE